MKHETRNLNVPMSNYRHNSDQISFMSSNTIYICIYGSYKKEGLSENIFKENFQ